MGFFKNNPKLAVIILFVITPIMLALGLNFLSQNKLMPKGQIGSQNQKLNFKCPSVDQFCKDGKSLNKDGVYLGFASQIPENSPIYAAIDGKMTVSDTTISYKNDDGEEVSEQLNTIYITREELTLIYYFYGDTSQEREVKKGDIIGKSLEKIAAYDTSLIFQVLKGDLKKGEKVQLSKEDFSN